MSKEGTPSRNLILSLFPATFNDFKILSSCAFLSIVRKVSL